MPKSKLLQSESAANLGQYPDYGAGDIAANSAITIWKSPIGLRKTDSIT